MGLGINLHFVRTNQFIDVFGSFDILMSISRLGWALFCTRLDMVACPTPKLLRDPLVG